MPKRSKSHQLEDQSRIALRVRLPQEWVFRDEHPDYGIDGSLEVFSEDGSPTGLRCFVQVKATSSKSELRKVRIRRDTGAYYKSLDIPVLIILYTQQNDRIFARWFHEFDPYYGGFGEKWITFSFEPEHVWTQETPRRLEKDLKTFRTIRSASHLPLPIPFSVLVRDEEVGGISAARVESVVRRGLQRHRRFFSHDTDGVLVVDISDTVVVVTFRGKHSFTVHTRAAPIDPKNFVGNILLMCSGVFGAVGDHGLAVTVAGCAPETADLTTHPEFVGRLLRSMSASGQVSKALDFVEKLMDRDGADLAIDQALAMAMLSPAGGGTVADRVETHLTNRIRRFKEAGNSVSAGTAHYNLGGYLRGQGRFREALRHFHAAGKVHDGYPKRDYFCREIGSVLFGLGFFTKSALFYESSLRLGGRPEWKGLHADALLFAGQFKAARGAFEIYLDGKENPRSEWVLKHWILGVILENEERLDGRKTKAAETLVGTAEEEAHPSYEDALKVLDLDPLNVSARLQIAAVDDGTVSGSERARSLLIAAVIARNDPRLWAQAFVHAGEDPELTEGLPWLVFGALETVKAGFPDSVHEYLTEVGLPDPAQDDLAKVLSEFEGIFERTRKPETQEIRIAGKGGEYETITLYPEGGGRDDLTD